MENAIPMHMVYGFKELEHVVLYSILGQVMPPSLDRVIKVHIHQLEDQCQSPRRLIIQYLIELNDLGVRTQTS